MQITRIDDQFYLICKNNNNIVEIKITGYEAFKLSVMGVAIDESVIEHWQNQSIV